MTQKIDRRKHYIMMLDTETCNTLVDEKGQLDMSSVLVYDLGWKVIDKNGKETTIITKPKILNGKDARFILFSLSLNRIV